MPINDYGFLGKDIKQYENKLIIKYKEVFDFYEDINHFLHKMRFKIDVKNNDLQGGTMVGLFCKSLTTFQAIYILFRHYLCNNAENLCRILFEEMVNVGYCSLGNDEAKRYLSLQLVNKFKIIKIVNEDKNKKYFPQNYTNSFFKEKSYDEQKKEIIEKIKSYGVEGVFNKKGEPKDISLRERIEKINSRTIMNDYLTFYRIVSAGVHSSPDILERYLIFYKDGLLKEIRWGPEAENSEINPIFAAIHFILIISEYLYNYFGIPEKKDIDQFFEKMKKLGKEHNYPLEEI